MSERTLPPIVTDENGDLNLFASLADAERDLEAVDVRDGAYEVFDSAGHRLVIVAEGETVQIHRGPQGDPEPDELASRLRRFALRVGPERVGLANPPGAELPGLVVALSTFFGL